MNLYIKEYLTNKSINIFQETHIKYLLLYINIWSNSRSGLTSEPKSNELG